MFESVQYSEEFFQYYLSMTKQKQGRPIFYKFLAVPSARVARMLAPLTYSPGLELVGGSAPKPLAYYWG
jgi:hypothetical protein